jgi:hypothetical protein
MDETPFRKVACPSCGAPLLFGPNDGTTTRCEFCGAVVERPAQPSRPAPLPPAAPGGSAPPPDWHPPAAPPPSRPIFAGLAFFLIALLAVGLLLIGIFFANSQSHFLEPSLHVNNPIELISAGPAAAPDFIAMAYDSSADTYLLARLSPANHRAVWRGKTFEEISAVRAIAAGEDKFFTAEGSRLMAYSAENGTLLWQAGLSDQLGYCDECLSARGNRVIALTQDYEIQAFDADAGASAWQRRMDGYTTGFSIADGALWVIDKVGDGYRLLLLSLADGTVQRQIVPECKREDGLWSTGLDASSMFLFDPDPSAVSSSRSVYLLYGWSPGCIERWDSSTGKMIWQTPDKDGYSPSEDYATLDAVETLFFSTESNLWAADKATGKIRILSQGGDYNLVPIALEQGTLIVRTERMRGTKQYGLWGVDPSQGETLWQYTFDKGAPLDPPDAMGGLVDNDESTWTWRMTGGQMLLMEFQAAPNQIIFRTLNPRDGSVTIGKTIALDVSGDFYAAPTIVAWQDPVVWVIVETKLLAIEISSMSVKYSYP